MCCIWLMATHGLMYNCISGWPASGPVLTNAPPSSSNFESGPDDVSRYCSNIGTARCGNCKIYKLRTCCAPTISPCRYRQSFCTTSTSRYCHPQLPRPTAINIILSYFSYNIHWPYVMQYFTHCTWVVYLKWQLEENLRWTVLFIFILLFVVSKKQ